jgi:hypothetical protein
MGGSMPNTRLVVLYSSMNDPDWPDFLDAAQGTFIYFGDNKRPGNGLEATPRGGNRLLRYCFDRVHASQRSQVPPFSSLPKAVPGAMSFFAESQCPASGAFPQKT